MEPTKYGLAPEAPPPEPTKADCAFTVIRWLGGTLFAIPIAASLLRGIVGLGQDVVRAGYLGLGWIGCAGIALWILPTWFEKQDKRRNAVQWFGMLITAIVLVLFFWSPSWVVEK